jgi:hypothetical protein
MVVHKRIPELDIVIMAISSKLKHPLLDLPFECHEESGNKLSENKLSEDKFKQSNVLVCGEYNQNNIEDPIFYQIEINADINLEFDILKYSYIHDIPSIIIPLHEILSIKQILNNHNLNIIQYHLYYNNNQY